MSEQTLPLFDRIPDQEELDRRDTALAGLQRRRSLLIAIGKQTAIDLARRQGTITSPEVLAEMEKDPEVVAMLKGVDRRFIGVVFRDKIWQRKGYSPTGSHGQPISVWKLNPAR